MYVYLDIVPKFSCQMCGKCCRNDWQITLSEESYQRNKSLFLSTGREAEFFQAFTVLNGSGGLEEYAYINKQANGGCWFLADENYCRLHRKAGHSHLDAVCQLFPRYPMSTGRGVELTLSFSCPAVVKLASRKAPLTIIRSEEPPLELLPGQFVAHVYPHQQRADNPLRYYFEIEQHFIDILQWRGATVNRRLQLLKDTARRISQLANMNASLLGTELSAVFYKNYDYFDANSAQQIESKTEILMENFFVNLIFKKVFYIYGFQKGVKLLETAAKQIEAACAGADSTSELSAVTQAIMAVEFQYGHNRSALLIK